MSSGTHEPTISLPFDPFALMMRLWGGSAGRGGGGEGKTAVTGKSFLAMQELMAMQKLMTLTQFSE